MIPDLCLTIGARSVAALFIVSSKGEAASRQVLGKYLFWEIYHPRKRTGQLHGKRLLELGGTNAFQLCRPLCSPDGGRAAC